MAQLVLFVDPAQGVVREMKYSSFKEFLAGGFGLPDFANREQLAAFVEVGSGLTICACVLFRLPLDGRGQVDEQWDLPFEQLTQSAGRGPDLGHGPIRLSSSIQCSVPWHQAKLWDPKEIPDIFEWLQQIVRQNHLGLNVEEPTSSDKSVEDEFELSGKVGTIIEAGGESPFGPGGGSGGFGPPGEVMPMHGYPMPMMPGMPYGGYDPSQLPPGYYPPGMMPGQFPMMPPQQAAVAAGEGGQAANSAAELLALQESFAKREEQYKQKIQAISQQHKTELAQYKKALVAQLLKATQVHERSLEEVSQELARLKKKIETLLSHKASLEEICEAQRVQVHDLGKKLTDFRKRAELRERESAEALARKYEATYGQKFLELDKVTQDRLQSQTAELQSSRAVIEKLQHEITELRRENIRAVNSDGDDVLSRLDESGITFIAFHAGAGHMSVPLNDVAIYVDNPVAYAARRCGVTEEVYRLWLSHEQQAVCVYQLGASACGCKIPKVDLPTDFKPGISDRCEKHRSLTADWEHAAGYGQ